MTHSYCSYALLWTLIFMLCQHCSIETYTEFGINDAVYTSYYMQHLHVSDYS